MLGANRRSVALVLANLSFDGEPISLNWVRADIERRSDVLS